VCSRGERGEETLTTTKSRKVKMSKICKFFWKRWEKGWEQSGMKNQMWEGGPITRGEREKNINWGKRLNSWEIGEFQVREIGYKEI